MRDIRKDLEERLKKFRAEKDGLLVRIKLLEEKITKLEELTKLEDSFWETDDQQEVLFPLTKSEETESTHTPLGQFLLSILQDGNTYLLDQLLTLAANQEVIVNSKSPRRALNFSLVGMQRHNLVERVGDGWRISNKVKGDENK